MDLARKRAIGLYKKNGFMRKTETSEKVGRMRVALEVLEKSTSRTV